MNRDFTRCQILPTIDAELHSPKSLESGAVTKPHATVNDLRLLFPLPAGEGQPVLRSSTAEGGGEGKRVALTEQGQRIKLFRV